jgi:hypothetical protein
VSKNFHVFDGLVAALEQAFDEQQQQQAASSGSSHSGNLAGAVAATGAAQ